MLYNWFACFFSRYSNDLLKMVQTRRILTLGKPKKDQ